MSKNLTEFEKEVYNFVKEHEEILASNMPLRMRGAVPNLKNKGLIVVYKKTASRWSSNKKKFIRPKESTPSSITS